MMKSISILFIVLFFAFYSCQPNGGKKAIESSRPNILFCIADDWSYPHAGAYGDTQARTPNFDKLAREGILFNNAFTASPSCSPSRAAILTGQEIYRLKEGGLLFGTLSQEHPMYTNFLDKAGYLVGSTGKAYGPTDLAVEGWKENPAGKEYLAIELEAPEGIRNTDYTANFKSFLDQKDKDQPFVFWYGASEPHRRYKYGIGKEMGFNIPKIEVPDFLPNHEKTRNDVADYYYELEWFDDHLGNMIKILEDNGELDNTIIVVTSDNGMPFPRAKSTLYNYGVQMPLAIKWGNHTEFGKEINEMISLTDLAPTFLSLAEIEIPSEMTGKDLSYLIVSEATELDNRDFVISALERHTICRPNNLGYPMRAIHTEEYTYIYNFEPDRYPGGDPDYDAWPQGYYGDVDDGASKTLFEKFPNNWPELFEYSFGKRPQEELFNVKTDRLNMNNLAENSDFQKIKAELKEKLFEYLQNTDDPRIKGLSPWDGYVFTGGSEWEK